MSDDRYEILTDEHDLEILPEGSEAEPTSAAAAAPVPLAQETIDATKSPIERGDSIFVADPTMGPTSLGDARRTDEAIIQNSDPRATEQNSNIKAFTKSTLNSASGGLYDLFEANDRAERGSASSFKEGLKQSYAENRKLFNEAPLSSYLGLGVGLATAGAGSELMAQGAAKLAVSAYEKAGPAVLKGLMKTFNKEGLEQATNLVAKAVSKQTQEAIIKNAAELTTLAAEGGILNAAPTFAVGVSEGPLNADLLEKVGDKFAEGSSFAIKLGLATKLGAGLLRSSSKILPKEEARGMFDVTDSSNSFEFGKDTGKYLLDPEVKNTITQRTANLPQYTENVIDTTLAKTTKRIDDRVAKLGDAKIDLRDVFTDIRKDANKLALATTENKEARNLLIKKLDDMEDSLGLSSQAQTKDPITNTIKIKPSVDDVSLARAHEFKKELQDLLYNKSSDFKSDKIKGGPVYKLTQRLEGKVRDRVSAADPTGELGRYNDVTHNLLNAKGEIPTVPQFESFAIAADKAKRNDIQKQFTQFLQTKSKNKKEFLSDRMGIKDETFKDPEIVDMITKLRVAIDAEAKPALLDRALLHKMTQTPENPFGIAKINMLQSLGNRGMNRIGQALNKTAPAQSGLKYILKGVSTRSPALDQNEGSLNNLHKPRRATRELK